MTHKLTYLKDAVGNNYVGINIPNEVVETHSWFNTILLSD